MSGCADVCLDMGYDGYNEFYAEKMVKARKQHTCCECETVIPVGAMYERVAGKTEGDFFTEATCALCSEIREAFVCGSWMFGRLWETISEVMFPIWNEKGPYDCLAKLTTPEAIKMCNDRYREWQEEAHG